MRSSAPENGSGFDTRGSLTNFKDSTLECQGPSCRPLRRKSINLQLHRFMGCYQLQLFSKFGVIEKGRALGLEAFRSTRSKALTFPSLITCGNHFLLPPPHAQGWSEFKFGFVYSINSLQRWGGHHHQPKPIPCSSQFAALTPDSTL